MQVPAQVDVPQLVLSEGQGRVALQDAHLWAAPLADELRQALSQHLQQDLQAEDVTGLAADADHPAYHIRVVVQRFDSRYGREVVIDAGWSVEAPDHKSIRCRSDIEKPVDAGYDALVKGHQHAVTTLAVQIAAGLEALQSGDIRCPQRG